MSVPRDIDDLSDDELVAELCRRQSARDHGECDYCYKSPSDEPCLSPRHRPSASDGIREKLRLMGLGQPGPQPSAPAIWLTRSEIDGYFVAVFTSPAGDAAAARARAWELYTGEDNRPTPDPSAGGEPEWKGYHTDPRGLVVIELGRSFVGSDGEGNLEADEDGDSDERRCGVRDGFARGRCTLPIGHGRDFPHEWEGVGHH